MLLDVRGRTEQPLLFPAEQDKTDRTLGLEPSSCNDARRFEHYHRARPIIGYAGTQIPTIQMGTEDHWLAGPLSSPDLGHRIPLPHRLATDAVLDRPRQSGLHPTAHQASE